MTAGFFGAFLDRAEHQPDRTAIVLGIGQDERGLSLVDLKRDARRWAGMFLSRGAKPSDVILIALPLCPDLIAAFLGALWVGCIPSLMPHPSAKQDPVLFWSSHDLLFARLGGGIIVATSDHRAAILANIVSATMDVVTPSDASAASADDDVPLHAWRGADHACLQHSSGTTGLKKGVLLSLDVIAAQVEAYAAALKLQPNDTIVSWLPLYHDMGFVACLLLPLSLGIVTVLIDPFVWLTDPLLLLEAVERHAGTLVWLPNFAFAHLVNAAEDVEQRFDLSSLRAVIDCSEPCRPETLTAFGKCFENWGLRNQSLSTCYAMAETVFAITQSALWQAPPVVRVDRAALDAGRIVEVAATEDGVSLVSSGTPIAGVELGLLDESLAPAASDRIGQIAVRAPFLFDGYHLEPDRSRATFHERFYLTGDLGFCKNGELFVLGRRDDLLILLGRNVFANEIESILGDVSGIRPGRLLAMGIPNRTVGSQELVILAERSADDVEITIVRATMRRRLESIIGIVPKKIIFVEHGWLMKSTSGKISRAENRRKYEAWSAEPSKGPTDDGRL